MPSGIKQLRQIQLGKEATAGTATTATTRWRGLGAFEDNREVTFPEEYIGIIGGGDRSYIAKSSGSFKMDDTDATFEQVPHLLIASIANTTAGVVQGTSSGYLYTYTIPTTTAPTIQTYTIRAGDDLQAEIMKYSFVKSFSLKGQAGEALMMSAEWVGRTISTGAYSTSVSVPDVETILSNKATLLIDPVSGTYGAGTLVTDPNTMIACEINFEDTIMPKWVMRPHGDDSASFAFHYAGNRKISGSVTFEHNTDATTEKEAFRNQTPRLLRFHFYGSGLTTAGALYTTKVLIVDLPIKYESFDSLDDIDGNSIIKANWVSRYNATVGNAGKVLVVLNGTTSIA